MLIKLPEGGGSKAAGKKAREPFGGYSNILAIATSTRELVPAQGVVRVRAGSGKNHPPIHLHLACLPASMRHPMNHVRQLLYAQATYTLPIPEPLWHSRAVSNL